MIRLLALIAFVSLVLSISCLAAAAALGGRDIAQNGWNFPDDWDVDIDHDHGGRHHWRHLRDSDDGPTTTREIPWTGGEVLEIGVPAEVRYTQAAGPGKLVITGPQDAVEHVELNGDRLRFDEPMARGARLTVIMTAPAVKRFALQGSGRLVIAGYRQDRLDIDMSGSAEVSAEGETRDLDLDISGSGEADLGRLTAQTAKVDIAGAGRATLAPRTAAEVEIAGSGEVTLLTRPTTLRSDVSGSGRIVQTSEEPAKPAPAKPAA